MVKLWFLIHKKNNSGNVTWECTIFTHLKHFPLSPHWSFPHSAASFSYFEFILVSEYLGLFYGGTGCSSETLLLRQVIPFWSMSFSLTVSSRLGRIAKSVSFSTSLITWERYHRLCLIACPLLTICIGRSLYKYIYIYTNNVQLGVLDKVPKAAEFIYKLKNCCR